ncbi:hypothetical protein SMKI_13G3030 [Saccharomyces mikatae IFO 1815]|uniref:YMR181C-like protein n=1 Tax=Saccharomyces mikatae IFO 1815 TaxID=226126 RepID=A0AA35IRM2_SACMI|nr:uncharacterized protein SMKI_13G3030 [Saccharomyces mikatae IFO 1815]CAI4035652.1 hypothetical protein SMKI_13G3030 [Saccharomyces mikatae IFO 1815]
MTPLLQAEAKMNTSLYLTENNQQHEFSLGSSHSFYSSSVPNSENNSGIFSHNSVNNSRVSSNDEFTIQQDGMNTIMYKNNISKTFEDDIFYCPRSLLTPEEQVVYQEIDKYYMEQALLTQLQISQTCSSSTPKEEKTAKFNPYTSKSFSPASSE